MERKFLEEFSLEKEAIDKILDQNSTDIGKAKGDLESVKNQLEQVKSELKTAKETVIKRDEQLESLRKSSAGKSEELQAQIEKLQADNQAKEEVLQAEIQRIRRDGIDNLLLSEYGAKNAKAVKALFSDLEDVDDDNYKMKRSEEIKALTEADDSKFLFESNRIITGTEPGAGTGVDPNIDFSKMTYEQLVGYLDNNPGAKLK